MTRKSRRSNRRKKSDSSKSGDTPPCKINTVARMSQQQQVDTSQILAQAHDSINRSQQSLSGSPVMPQQLVFPNPAQAGLPNPGVQSNAPYIQIRHGIPVPENTRNNFKLPAVTQGNILPPPPPPISIAPVNMQTIFANIALINEILEKMTISSLTNYRN